MRPNKSEVDALREVLMTPLDSFVTEKEAAEHKDPEGLAQNRMFTKAIEAVDAARGSRVTYSTLIRLGGIYIGTGPYSTRDQATKALTEQVALHDPDGAIVVPYRNQEGLAQLIEELDAVPEKRKPTKEAEELAKKKMSRCQREVELHIRPDRGRGAITKVGNVWDLRRQEGLE